MSTPIGQVLDADRAPAGGGRASTPPAARRVQTDPARREKVLARLTDNPHLPSPPGIVLQILEKASRLDCAPADLVADIHRDVALCGKILKTVNSALYGMPRSITSIKQAVALLGLKPLRSLVLSLSLPAMQRSVSPPLPVETFWKESVAGAMVAHELAVRLHRPCPEDDLVAGLLRDLGALALHQVFPHESARLLTHRAEELIADRCRLERQLLGVDHAEVSAFVLRRWWLPEEITEAIRHHHAPERAEDLPRPVAERVRLLAFASQIAQLQLGDFPPELLPAIFTFGHEHYGLDEAALTAFLEPLAKKIDDFASLLDLDIGACEHYPQIMARAAEQLVQLTLETRADQLRILEQKKQAEQETKLWRAEAQRLRGELQRDPLTGAYNRGCLEVELQLQFRRARRRGTLLGLVFIDLDDFKGVNDRFGHLFGDCVLKETARNLFASVRSCDVVARYGGDEFCVLVENTSPERLRAMAQRLCEMLNESSIAAENETVTVHASIGAVICLPRSYPRAVSELLDAADRAMYAGKTTGKNQITFVSLLDDADLPLLRLVERKRFGTWLSEMAIAAPLAFSLELNRSCSHFEAPGRLARRLGWLTTPQLGRVLQEQRQTGKYFDEIAREFGLLTSEQLAALHALQLETPEDLAATLVDQGIFSEAEMRENLRKYYQWLGSPESEAENRSEQRCFA